MTQSTAPFAALLELVQKCTQAGEYAQAYALLQQGLANASLAGIPAEHAQVALLRKLARQLAPFWWQPLGNADLRLRRVQRSDAPFFESCFADADWAQRYNRQRPWVGDLGNALHKAGSLPPLQLGQLQWVIEGGAGQPLGLASLTSLDIQNRKAELSIGMVNGARGIPTFRALMWMMHFAFLQVGLNRLYSYVYTDNPEAKTGLEKLGFTLEGCLRDHYYLPPGRFFDIWVLGMTHTQWCSHPRLPQQARRMIGVDWPTLREQQKNGNTVA